eukprot:625673-Prymnesium_polylepis.1
MANRSCAGLTGLAAPGAEAGAGTFYSQSQGRHPTQARMCASHAIPIIAPGAKNTHRGSGRCDVTQPSTQLTSRMPMRLSYDCKYPTNTSVRVAPTFNVRLLGALELRMPGLSREVGGWSGSR